MKLLTYSGATLADLSPPARGRGLKPAQRATIRAPGSSPPARGRGLKLQNDPVDQVAQGRRPPRGGVD